MAGKNLEQLSNQMNEVIAEPNKSLVADSQDDNVVIKSAVEKIAHDMIDDGKEFLKKNSDIELSSSEMVKSQIEKEQKSTEISYEKSNKMTTSEA
ncbi:hypothetical protein BLA29_013522, partial [Euroglyphus maynei]